MSIKGHRKRGSMYKVILFGLVITLAGVASQQLISTDNERDAAAISYVQDTCDYARGTINSEDEARCGLAQDVTHTNYLCKNSRCWVEAK